MIGLRLKKVFLARASKFCAAYPFRPLACLVLNDSSGCRPPRKPGQRTLRVGKHGPEAQRQKPNTPDITVGPKVKERLAAFRSVQQGLASPE